MRRRPPRSTLCPYTTLFRSAYRLGSLTHADPAIRRRAVEHHAQCIDVMRQTGSTDLKIWLPDGTNYPGDRKSTRLNSSHANNSYAVFCLKKKTSLIDRYPFS